MAPASIVCSATLTLFAIAALIAGGVRLASAQITLSNGATIFGPCQGPEMYRIPDGRDYRGFVNVTVSGYTCQTWTSQTPQQQNTPIDASLGIGNHNYCRNPFVRQGLQSPGCFTMNPNVRFEACSVGPPCDPTNAPSTAPVVFNATATMQTSPFTFAMSSATSGAYILYTLDGSVPTPASAVAPAAITITTSGLLTVTAYAWYSGYQPSSVVVQQYYVSPAPLVSVTISPGPAPLGLSYNQPVLVTLSSPDVGVNIFYTTDGTLPDETSIPYVGPFWIKSTSSVTAVSTRIGTQRSAAVAVIYIMSVPAMPFPTITPMGGVFFGSVTLALYTPIPFGYFSYASNASASQLLPGGSSTTLVWTSPGTTVLTFVASSTSMADSAPLSIAVTILPIPVPTFSSNGGTFTQSTTVTVNVDASYIDPTTKQRTMGSVSVVLLVNGKRQASSLVTLAQIGVFNLEAFSRTRFGDSTHVFATFNLQSVPLPPPQITPDPQSLDPNFLFSSPVTLTLFGNSQSNFVVYTRSSDTTFNSPPLVFSGLTVNTLPLFALGSGNSVSVYTLAIVAVSGWNNPFAANSTTVTRSFRVAPPGLAQSSYFRYTSTAPFVAGAANGVIRQALFLPAAGIDAANYVYVLYETPYVVFRLQNMQPDAIASVTWYLLSQLTANATSSATNVLATLQATDVRVLQPFFTTKCFSRSADLSAAGFLQLYQIPFLTPGACSAQCAAVSGAQYFAVTGTASCMCTRGQPTGQFAVDWSQCAAPCAGDSSQTCGSLVAFQFFARVPNATRTFALAQSWTIQGVIGQTMVATTTSPFDLSVSAINPPPGGGLLKFVASGTSCATLAPISTFDSSGASRGVIVRTASQGMYLCVAFSDDPTNFFLVPQLFGRTLTVVASQDIAVFISPNGGTFVNSVTFNISTNDGTSLEITVDRQPVIRVPAKVTTITVNTIGTHVVTAIAVTNGGNKGAPVSALVVIASTAPPLTAHSSIRGFTYTTAGDGSVKLALVGSLVPTPGTQRWARIVLDPTQCGNAGATAFFTGTSTVSGNTTQSVVTSDASFNFGNARMDRTNLTVCFGEQLVTESAPVFTAVAPLDAATASLLGLSVPAWGWTLSVAAANAGRCAASFASVCANGGTCSASSFQGETEMACMCPSSIVASTPNATFLCTIPQSPSDLVWTYWNGTGSIPISGAGTTSGGSTAPRATPQGSLLTLLILNLCFVASLVVLYLFKRREAAASGAGAKKTTASVASSRAVARAADDPADKNVVPLVPIATKSDSTERR